MSSDPERERAALTQSPDPVTRELPQPRPPLKEDRRPTSGTLQTLTHRTGNTLRKQWAKYIVISAVITLVAIAISLVTAYKLLVDDVNYQLPVGQAAMRLSVDLLAVDPIAGTMTLDWWPRTIYDCDINPPPPGGVFDIYFDPNLILADGGGGNNDPPPSNAQALSPTFTFNATKFCHMTLKDSTATFRTNSKLISDDNARGSLQAYPFDLYKAQISLFVLDNSNNGSVRAEVSKTWGVAVNFEVSLDPNFENQINTVEGIYYVLNVSRSTAVKVFVMFIVIANWIVTLVFLWITIACLFWQERVVRELFVVPVSVLFAFTAVRGSMPGSPAGFGAFIDFVGILPNLALLTFCSFILLLVVLYQRIVDTYQDIEQREAERAQENQRLLLAPEPTPGQEKEMV